VKTYKEFLNENNPEALEQKLQDIILAEMVIKELDINLDYINESNDFEMLEEGVNDILKKFGLELEKKSPGVIEYITKFAKGAGQMIYYAIKGDKQKVKQLAKSITKEEVIDFLLKLDMLTLHAVSGPIHAIDAATGWDLWANVEKVAQKGVSVIDSIKKAIKVVKDKITGAFAPKLQPVAIAKLNDLEGMLQ
jgi:hypothetical protein